MGLKIKSRLIFGFAAGVALLFGVGMIGYVALSNTDATLHQLIEQDVAFTNIVARLEIGIPQIKLNQRDFVLNAGKPAEQQNAIKAFDAQAGRMKPLFARVAKMAQESPDFSAELKQRSAGLVDGLEKFTQSFNSLAAKGAGAPEFASALWDFQKQVELPVSELSDAGSEISGTRAMNGIEQGTRAKKITLVVIIIGSILLFGIAFVMARSIATPLSGLTKVAETLRLGDFSQRIRSKRLDEIGQLAAVFDSLADGLAGKEKVATAISNGNLTTTVQLISQKDSFGKTLQNMIKSLCELISHVQLQSGKVAGSAQQMKEASQSLSDGATKQAASLEEVSSSVNEISSKTRTNAENANQASQLAKATQEAGVRGTEQMQVTVGAMNEINTSSAQIAKIIKVIDDIAFQTNLLALNAAVEAARAGKHGKGFAVVADEVRNLAGRSAKAAKETGELIESSLAKVEKGVHIATTTAEVFKEILSGSEKVATLVGEIAVASNDQALGIAQISEVLNQIDQITQQNTAAAEETASAAEELSGYAGDLRQSLSRFTLPEGQKGQTGERPALENLGKKSEVI